MKILKFLSEFFKRFLDPHYGAILTIRQMNKRQLQKSKPELLKLMNYLSEMYGLELKEFEVVEGFREIETLPPKRRRITIKAWGKNFVSNIKSSPQNKEEENVLV